MSRSDRYQLESLYRSTVISRGLSGTAVMQLQTGVWSRSTSQAWHEPIKQPVGMVMPARLAASISGSPGSASTVLLSGKKRIVTAMALVKLKREQGS